MAKELKIENLLKDLEYVINGTDVQERLFDILPPGENKTTLELGCGSGKFSLGYALKGTDSWMVDIDPEVLEYARRLRNALNALKKFPLPTTIKGGSIFAMHLLKLPKEGFDLVFNEGFVDHFTDQEIRQKCVDEMARVSKNFVVVMGANGLNPREVQEDKDMTFTYMGMPPKRKSLVPGELEMLLKKAGLEKIKVEPLYPGKTEDSPILVGWGRKKK